jgi:hypothetical protein
MRLWHGTLPVIAHALRTSGVAFPFVLERLSNTHQEASPRTARRCYASGASLSQQVLVQCLNSCLKQVLIRVNSCLEQVLIQSVSTAVYYVVTLNRSLSLQRLQRRRRPPSRM